jgi:hypothetical protein
MPIATHAVGAMLERDCAKVSACDKIPARRPKLSGVELLASGAIWLKTATLLTDKSHMSAINLAFEAEEARCGG